MCRVLFVFIAVLLVSCGGNPGLLIGLADPADCPDEFIKQYNLKLDDNPVLIMVKCK